MPYNLLLLPLLGGFLFLRWWNPTRYHALRAEKERLLILAAIPGLMSLIAAFALVSGLGYLFPCASWPRVPCFPAWWQSHVPFDYAGTSLLAFALGATAWKPLNLVCSRDKAIDRIIEEDKDAFEILLKKAQDNANTVAVTMSNGKVYVGYVLHTFNPAFPTRFIKILPTKSGYRDDLDKTYHFTVFYSEALDQIDLDFEQNYNDFLDVEHQLKDFTDKKGDKTKAEKKKIDKLEAERQKLEDILDQIALEADAFGIVLPVSEIRSLNIFSEYIHSKYFSSPAEHANET
ncbi:MAG: hypothetical protein QOE77_1174 [Blastocatellia bacterium]|jgi:hypothetical protein|nr:hypothetical protein [Blastocatellia bacterium]